MTTLSIAPLNAALTDEQRDALKADMRHRMDAEMRATWAAHAEQRHVATEHHQGRYTAFYEIWCALDAGRL